MAMSVLMQAVHAKAAEYDKTIKATDPRLRRMVMVHHEDGTFYNFRFAFLMRVTAAEYLYEQEKEPGFPAGEQGWVVVFTEHNGFHVFAAGDLHGWQEYEEVQGWPEELPV